MSDSLYCTQYKMVPFMGSIKLRSNYAPVYFSVSYCLGVINGKATCVSLSGLA